MTTREFHKGEILPHIIYLSWPVLAANAIQSILSMFDIMWMGKVGVSALSAASICGPVLSIFWAVESGFLAGSVALVSRFCGERKFDRIGTAAFNLSLTGFIFSLIFAVVMAVFAAPVLSFFGAKGETLTAAVPYFRVMAFSYLNISVLYIMIAVVRGAGHSRTAFATLLTGQVLFLVLEPVLIFGLLPGTKPMGMAGAAIAYAFSYLAPTAVIFFVFFRGMPHFKMSTADLKVDAGLIRKFIWISAPAMIQSLAINIAIMAVIKIASRYGDSLLGAIGIASRLDMFSNMMGIAIGNGVSVMVGHNLGAMEVERAKKSVTEGIRFFWMIAIPLSALYIIFAPHLVAIFSKDAGVIRYGTAALRIVPFVYALSCVWLMTSSAFQGAGATNLAMMIGAGSYLAVQVPLAFVLSRMTFMNGTGIFFAIAACQAVMGITGWMIYKKGKWINV